MINRLVTLVVPTYNRPKELERLLSFLSGMISDINVIVLDGSKEDSGLINQKICEKFINVKYYKFPSTMHLGLRLCEGAKLVKTPFMAFWGDDDIIIPESAIRCARFLEAHPDYTAAIGQIWTLRYFPKLQFIRKGIALGDDLGTGSKFDQKHFIVRSLFYFAYTAAGSIPLYYAVRRTDQTIKFFSLITEHIKYSSMELLTNCLLLIEGRVAKIAVPFGFRDYASVTTRDPEREGAEAYIPNEDIEYIRPLLVDSLIRKEELSAAQAKYVVESLLSLWNGPEEHSPFHPMEPSTSRWIRYISYASQCILGRVAPKFIANLFGVPEDVYRCLLRAHQRFTASRTSVG